MKRVVNYRKVNDKYEVIYISNPVSDEIANQMVLDNDNCGVISGDFEYPPIVENKSIKLYFNKETSTIEYKYIDVDFESLPTNKKIEMLKKENADLKYELELTQQALFELDAYVSGDEIIPPEDDDSKDDNIPEGEDSEDSSEDETPSEDSEETPIQNNLSDLVVNAQDGDTITLNGNVELEEPLVINKILTLNLNGFTLSSQKDVILVRSSRAYVNIIGDGTIVAGNGNNYKAIYVSAGTVNIDSVSVIGGINESNLGNTCIYACGSGIVNINSGTFSAELNGDIYPVLETNGEHGTINVTGGQFKNYNPAEHEEINMDSTIYKVTKINDDTYLVEVKTGEEDKIEPKDEEPEEIINNEDEAETTLEDNESIDDNNNEEVEKESENEQETSSNDEESIVE